MTKAVRVCCNMNDITDDGVITKYYLIDNDGYYIDTQSFNDIKDYAHVTSIGGFKRLAGNVLTRFYLTDGTPLWLVCFAEECSKITETEMYKVGKIVKDCHIQTSATDWKVLTGKMLAIDDILKRPHDIFEEDDDFFADDIEALKEQVNYKSCKRSPVEYQITYQKDDNPKINILTMRAEVEGNKRRIYITKNDDIDLVDYDFNMNDSLESEQYNTYIKGFKNGDAVIINKILNMEV